jgi:ribosomal protein L13E
MINKHYQRGFDVGMADRDPDPNYGLKTALMSHTYAVYVQEQYGRGFAAGRTERAKSEKHARDAAADRLRGNLL